jgi:outer membrane protein OmpA-like peptidoglycan-associated protein
MLSFRGTLRLYDAPDGEIILIPSWQWHSLRREGGYQEADRWRAVWALNRLADSDLMKVRGFLAETEIRFYDRMYALPQASDHAVRSTIIRAIEEHRIIAIRKDAGPTRRPQGKGSSVELRRLIEQVEKAGRLSFQGRQYKLVVAGGIESVPDRDRYEVVPQADARAILEGLAKESPSHADGLHQAGEKIGKDWRHTSQPESEGLALLRWVPAPVFASKADDAPAITPSQMRHLVESRTELGIFEVHVIDEVADKVSGLEMTFTIEGNEISKKTGGDGKARVDTEPGTFATVALVDVQAARDLLKARWDKARGKPLIEPEEDVVVYRLGGEAPRFGLESKKPRTLSIEPYVIRGRLFGGFFDTSKSFVLPSGLDGVRGLVELQGKHPNTLLLVVGHTDTAGKPSYNDPLSLERAAAMVAYLKGTVNDWYAWYDKGVATEKRWGNREDLAMIATLPDADERDSSENPVQWFQRTRGLEVDDIAGTETRHALIKEYMGLEGTTLPAGVEVKTHGCGENFPIDDTGDGVDDQDNRRVEIFFFDAKLGVQPKPPDKNSAPGSLEYPEWVTRSRSPIDFSIQDDLVELAFEWPEDVVDELPDDIALVLTGDDIDPQKQFLAMGDRDDGVVRVSFGDLDPGQQVTLTAKLGDQELVLFRDHQVGDLDDPAVWEHDVDEFFREEDPDNEDLTAADAIPDDAEADLLSSDETDLPPDNELPV